MIQNPNYEDLFSLNQFYPLNQRHACIAAPLVGAALFVVQIVQVVHVGIGLHLERVQPVAGISQMLAVAAGQQPVPAVAKVEQQPRVVTGAGLVEVYHFMVLNGAEAFVERLGILFGMGDDVSEEGQPVVAPANPAGHSYGAHVVLATGARGAEHHQNYIHSDNPAAEPLDTRIIRRVEPLGTLNFVKGLLDVGEDVVAVLDADAEADQVGGYAGLT